MKKVRGPDLRPDTPVEALINLSQLTGSWLREEGACTHADLAATDLITLWLRLKSQHRQVTKLMYYALWGAVHDQHWNRIPASEKDRIDAVVRTNRAKTSRK